MFDNYIALNDIMGTGAEAAAGAVVKIVPAAVYGSGSAEVPVLVTE